MVGVGHLCRQRGVLVRNMVVVRWRNERKDDGHFKTRTDMRKWIGRVGEAIVDVVIVIYVMMEGIVVVIWEFLKGLFSKKKQEEDAVEERNPGYQCRCHQCGEEFKAAGVMMEGFPSTNFLLIDPKECPKCGSFKIMPVMFEYSEFHVKGYQRMWERKEIRIKEQEERRLRSEAKKRTDEANRRREEETVGE